MFRWSIRSVADWSDAWIGVRLVDGDNGNFTLEVRLLPCLGFDLERWRASR